MKNAQGTEVEINDNDYYEIVLNWAVRYKNRLLSPMAKNTVKGVLLKSLPEDAISDVKPV